MDITEPIDEITVDQQELEAPSPFHVPADLPVHETGERSEGVV